MARGKFGAMQIGQLVGMKLDGKAEGALDCRTELGWLRAEPGTVILVPRGIKFSIAVPRSGWVTSRPRNMIVILTLSPCLRKRTTWPFFVS